MEHPPGTVLALAHDAARFTSFNVSITALAHEGLPPGSRVRWGIGISVAESLNKGVREFLDTDGRWLCILGDDHAFNTDTVERLLDLHLGVVAPVVLYRYPPLQPVAWGMDGNYLMLNEHPAGGVVEVAACGTAGMVIQRRVLEALDDPWFELGQIDSELLSEDVLFCQKMRHAGFDIFVDLDTALAHIAPVQIFPRRKDGRWEVAMMFPQEQVVSFPHDTFYP